jgi:hypothetical protein
MAMARTAYSEQVGWNLHPPTPSVWIAGDNQRW